MLSNKKKEKNNKKKRSFPLTSFSHIFTFQNYYWISEAYV
jgi:hypothetical protein